MVSFPFSKKSSSEGADKVELDYYQSDLYEHFLSKRKRRTQKWHHYFPIYDWHFKRFKGMKPTIVEIGVAGGGSLEIWRRYFGDDARIIGVDINDSCKRFEADGVEIMIGDQGDEGFLRELAAHANSPDIIIDDGGHTANQMIKTFELLFPELANNGVFITEDCHTSIWPKYVDRYDGLTFLDYAKSIAEKPTWWHITPNNARFKTNPSQREGEVSVPEITRNLWSVSFYDSVVAFEKRIVPEPWNDGR